MASLASDILTDILPTAAELFGDAVQYAREGVFDFGLTDVIRGRTEWKGFGQGGVVVISESVDWLVPVDQLVLPESPSTRIDPQQYDTITVTVSGIVYTYDLQPFGPDELIGRVVDRDGRSVVRLFSKLLSEVPA